MTRKYSNSTWILLLAAVLIAIIWQLPFGRQILLPISLLATFAHEMGHGLTALLTGSEFTSLVINADGSGMAVHRGNPSRVASALIAAGGLIGPTVAGVALLVLSRSAQRARGLLFILSIFILLSVGLWVRNPFGVVFLLGWAGVLMLGARFLPGPGAAFLLHLIAVTLCLSWFTDLNYMFSDQALVNGSLHLSDSAGMAQALWLPYWFWGAAVALCSLGLLVMGIRMATARVA